MNPELLRALAENGLEKPSAMQVKYLTPALLGKDVITATEACTDKTTLFVLATLYQLVPIDGEVSVLVLCHTKQLANEIKGKFDRFAKYMRGVKTAISSGEIPLKENIALLKRNPPHIMVATPGRLKDLMIKGLVNLSNVRHLVVDQGDELLVNPPLRTDAEFIAKATPPQKQHLVFAETMSENVQAFCKNYCRGGVSYANDWMAFVFLLYLVSLFQRTTGGSFLRAHTCLIHFLRAVLMSNPVSLRLFLPSPISWYSSFIPPSSLVACLLLLWPSSSAVRCCATTTYSCGSSARGGVSEGPLGQQQLPELPRPQPPAHAPHARVPHGGVQRRRTSSSSCGASANISAKHHRSSSNLRYLSCANASCSYCSTEANSKASAQGQHERERCRFRACAEDERCKPCPQGSSRRRTCRTCTETTPADHCTGSESEASSTASEQPSLSVGYGRPARCGYFETPGSIDKFRCCSFAGGHCRSSGCRTHI